MMTSWKTTATGVVTILFAVATAVKALIDGATPDIGALSAAIVAGIGLILAKDSNVTGGTVGSTTEARDRVGKALASRVAHVTA